MKKAITLLILNIFILFGNISFAQKEIYYEKHNDSYFFDFAQANSNNISKTKIVTKENFFQEFSAELQMDLKNDAFSFIKSENDKLGFTHHHYKQMYNNVPVEGSGFILHEKNGTIQKTNGKFFSSLKVNTTPTISENEAVKNALAAVKGTDHKSTTPLLVIAPQKGIYQTDNFKLCYKITVTAQNPYQIYNVFIDAHTGTLVNKITRIAHSDVTGSGTTLYSGTKSFTTDSYSGSYRLRETGRPIETYNMQNGTDYTSAVDFTDSDNHWATNAALDAHWAAEKVYDFYLSKFNRNSFDNAGSVIKNYVHYDVKLDNAFWDGTQMSYGDGNSLFTPLTSIDVVGHELSHGVVQYNGGGGLDYIGESGALNESFADIFGTSVEFFGASVPNWTMGEAITKVAPYYIRSMADPNSGLNPQPDTYKGEYWDPQEEVHTNSGVQNCWFYLLSQGGSGTNDLSNSYSVTGIGISKAQQIAYRNLTTYISASTASTYLDSYYGSLQSAIDLYGSGSAEYLAVRAAWYAVGIGGSPTGYCDGTMLLDNYSATFSDGSGTDNYSNNADCRWLIQPSGSVSSITLDFNFMDIEPAHDQIIIYDGADISAPILGTFSGSVTPSSIVSTGGSMLVRFITNGTVVKSGWDASYTSSAAGGTIYCNAQTDLTSPSASFSDGSGANDYSDNSNCSWYIHPTGATRVILSFSDFNTEDGLDFVNVYDDQNQTNLLGSFSGGTIPSSVVSTTGQMFVVFTSDGSVTYSGWDASYTSSSEPIYCNGQTDLTAPSDSFSDGSGLNNYSDNSSCSWYIHPAGATTVTLSFSSFDTQNGYDYIAIYDEQNNLLGSFSGSTIPPPVISTTGQMLVVFSSNDSVDYSGWDASYTSFIPYCNGQTDLTAPSDSLSDGSGLNNYSDNSNCSWYIHPIGATTVTLSFSAFDTENGNDYVAIYDDQYQSNLLGYFSGNSIPSPIISTTGQMLVVFYSNDSVDYSGWSANYTSFIPYCYGQTDLTAPSASFSDGSGLNSYSDNSNCSWYIHPIGAATVTLSFSAFDTENGNDYVAIYDDLNQSHLLGSFSGSTIPSSIISTTGQMLVVFYSNDSVDYSGWNANYTSSAPYCSGQTDLTASSASFSDGSGLNSYSDNSYCSWYIHPVGASSVTLSFSSFQTESGYDSVNVYDDLNQTNLLGGYSGSTIPSPITSATGKMYVVFFSDGSDNFSGWDASYTSSSAGGEGSGNSPYCNGTADLTTPTGTFSDGSGATDYTNNSNCSWYIHPAKASSVTLSLTSFDTESGYDFVKIYDDQNKTNLLGSYSGANTIAPITSNTGKMMVVFSSNSSVTNTGWDASYTSAISTGIEQNFFNNTLKITPNPNNGIFSLSLDQLTSEKEEIKIFNSVGQIVWSNTNLPTQTKYEIDLSEFNAGLYLVVVSLDNKRETAKIIVTK